MKKDTLKNLNSAGVTVQEQDYEFRFRINDDALFRSDRFSSLRRCIFDSKKDLAPLLAHLAILDMVDPELLMNMQGKNFFVHNSLDHTILDLDSSSDLLWRVSLSTFSAAITPHEFTLDAEHVEAFASWVMSTGLYAPSKTESIIFQLRLDQLSWSFEHLHPVLFAWSAGLIELTQLPVHSIACADTQLVPKLTANVQDVQVSLACGEALDLLDSVPSHAKHDPLLIQVALNCLTINHDSPEYQQVDICIRALQKLQPRFKSAAPHTVIVYAWICDIIESGTVKKGEHSRCATRIRYAKVLAPALHDALQTLPVDVEDWSASERREAFRSAIFHKSTSDQSIALAALSCFQQYLDECFGVEPIWAINPSEIQASQVRAQYISAACVSRCIEWITASTIEDDLFKKSLLCALSAGAAAPFRINELLHLRKQNIHRCNDGSYELEIAGIPSMRKLKSHAATRRVYVRDRQAIFHLEALIERRGQDNWISCDFLFAHGCAGGEIYRKHALHKQLLILLKATTGDPRMTFHSLRHSVATNCFLDAFSTQTIVSFNRLSHISHELGHASIGTSLHSYFHLPELALRKSLDLSDDSIDFLTSTKTAAYCSIPSATIRQRAKRSNQSVSITSMQTLDQTVHTRNCVSLVDKLQLQAPCPISISGKTLYPFTPATVLDALQLGEDGLTVRSVIAHRLGIELDVLTEIFQSSASVMKSLSARKLYSETAAITPVATFKFSAANQPKYEHILKRLHSLEMSDQLVDGIHAWEAARNRYGYFALTEPSHTHHLLRLLHQLGARSGELSFHVIDAGDIKSKIELERALNCFTAIFKQKPHVFTSDASCTRRPTVYLGWCSSKADQLTPGSSTSLKGLDAILVSLKVFQTIKQMEIA